MDHDLSKHRLDRRIFFAWTLFFAFSPPPVDQKAKKIMSAVTPGRFELDRILIIKKVVYYYFQPLLRE